MHSIQKLPVLGGALGLFAEREQAEEGRMRRSVEIGQYAAIA